MRKRLIVAITFVAGIYFIIEFLLPEYFPSGFGPSGAHRGFKFGEYHEEILTGLQSVSMAAIGLGLVNIFRVFGVNVVKRRKGWPYSLTLICGMLLMMFVMFWDWSENLGNQHQVGPLGTQRKFQSSIMSRIGGPVPPPQLPRKEMVLGRYLADTRAAVSPPDVGVEEAAAHLTSLANLLKGSAAAPRFFKLADGPGSPLLANRKSPEDLLKLPESPAVEEPLRSADAAATLAKLASRRDEIVGEVSAAAQKIEALKADVPAGEKVAATLKEQASACRSVAPRLRELAGDVWSLADAERGLYEKPEEFDLRFKGARKAPPPPPFGRFYIASRSMTQAAHVLERFANVLERAAVGIPAVEQDQRALAEWLAKRLAGAKELRDLWREGAVADQKRAVPEVKNALTEKLSKVDALRQRMLDGLAAMPEVLATYDKGVEKLGAVSKALEGDGEKDAKLKSAGEALTQAAAELQPKDGALRLQLIRRVEQDLRYLGLDEGDAKKVIPAELATLAGGEAEADKAKTLLEGIAGAAKQELETLVTERKKLEASLKEEVKALRKVWKEKSAEELRTAREEQDWQIRAIADLKRREELLADAQSFADRGAKQVAPTPGVKALADLTTSLPTSEDLATAREAVEKARQALENQRTAAVTDAAKVLERMAFKDDLKDVRLLMAALSATKALVSAERSAAMIRRAASDASLAADAVKANDLTKARGLMQRVSGQLGGARMGAHEALAETGERSMAKSLRKVLFHGLYVALGAAMFSLLAFYMANAAYRAFRVKSAEAVLMMVAALLVMLGQIPFGAYISGELPYIRLWVMQVFSTPAFRGIALGASVAFLAMAMRMWLSLETKSFYREDEATEEGA